jgi:hypothetical protein
VGKFGFIGSVGVCYPYTINSNDSHPNWMIGGIIRYHFEPSSCTLNRDVIRSQQPAKISGISSCLDDWWDHQISF